MSGGEPEETPPALLAPSVLREAALRGVLAGVLASVVQLGFAWLFVRRGSGPQVPLLPLLLWIVLPATAVGLASAPTAWVELLHPAGRRRGPVSPGVWLFLAAWAGQVAGYAQIAYVAGIAAGRSPPQAVAAVLEGARGWDLHVLALGAAPPAAALAWLSFLRWRGARLRAQLFEPTLLVALAMLALLPGAGRQPSSPFLFVPLLATLFTAPALALAAAAAARLEVRWSGPARAPVEPDGWTRSWVRVLVWLVVTGGLIAVRTGAYGALATRAGAPLAVAILALAPLTVAQALALLFKLRLRRAVAVPVAFAPVDPTSERDEGWLAAAERACAPLLELGFTPAGDREVVVGEEVKALARFLLHPSGVAAAVSAVGPEPTVHVAYVSDFPGERRLITTDRPLDAITWVLSDAEETVFEARPGEPAAALHARHQADREQLRERWDAPRALGFEELLARDLEAVACRAERVERAWALPLLVRVLQFGEPPRAGRFPGPLPPRPQLPSGSDSGSIPAVPEPQTSASTRSPGSGT